MREMKFRGKRLDNSEWVYGYYFVGASDTHWIVDLEHTFRLVDKETVEQFTGLLDKNGKQIYEGDIVNLGIDGRVKHTRIAQVMFKPDIIFNSNVGIFNYGDFAYQDTYNHLTVIGNIHDNPELLEVKQ